MTENAKETDGWREYLPDDASTHPEHDSIVGWEFSDGNRLQAVFGENRVWPFDPLPKNLPRGIQKWRYKSRESNI